ncbi:hypothethical protein [Ralstonia solanacearum PSI07]|nr:hypothethical protein [Ralstonia solanacearum PSI07]
MSIPLTWPSATHDWQSYLCNGLRLRRIAHPCISRQALTSSSATMRLWPPAPSASWIRSNWSSLRPAG